MGVGLKHWLLGSDEEECEVEEVSESTTEKSGVGHQITGFRVPPNR